MSEGIVMMCVCLFGVMCPKGTVKFLHGCFSAWFSVPVDPFCSEFDARGCPLLADVFVLLGGKEKIPAPVLGGFIAHPEDQ